jgi:hypothetical protein
VSCKGKQYNPTVKATGIPNQSEVSFYNTPFCQSMTTRPHQTFVLTRTGRGIAHSASTG